MALPDELVSQLVKIVGARGSGNTDYSVYGTIVESGGQQYVRFDGSDINTPFESTVEVSDKDRVIVEVKGHTATVTGNTSHPSLGKKTADGFQSLIEQNANSIEFAVEKIGETQASIKLLPESIKSTVKQEYFDPLNTTITGENGISARLESAETTIEQMPESITSTVKTTLIDPINGEVNKFSEFKQKFDSFEFITEGGKVKIGSGNLQLTGAISFSDLKDYSTVNSKISNAASDSADAYDIAVDAAYDASSALSKANSTNSTLTKLLNKNDKTTYIDGSKILTESLYVDKIKLGERMTVYKTLSGTNIGGHFGYTAGFNSTRGIGMWASDSYNTSAGNYTPLEGQCVCTEQAARLSYGSAAQFVASKTGYINIDGSAIVFELSGTERVAIANHTTYYALRPCGESSPIYLGQSSNRWAAVYATNGTIQTSDRNYKHDIETIPDKYITMFDHLVPRRFKMNEGSSGRYHIGYIAQEVEEAMSKAGIDSLEFGGFVRGDDGEGKEICMLRYDEFDAIRDAKIKQLEARLAAIEERIKS